MPLPISVIIPHQKHRAEWFKKYCLPAVVANDPAEILIESGEGNACEKRNAGAGRAKNPYVVFVDDDSIIYADALPSMLAALERDRGASFAYSDVKTVHYPGIPSPVPQGTRSSGPWNLERLKRWNYVDTMSLMRREVFPGFDVKLRRFQDWDLWLRMGANGRRGVYIPKVLFELHYFDLGISAVVPVHEALQAISEKHGIILEAIL